MTAPVILFAFNRPDHTARTIASLAGNALASETEVVVFLDGPRNAADVVLIESVETAIGRHALSFRVCTTVRRDRNMGLAANIIAGVSHVCAYRGRAIVLEDDLVTSPHFLTYMNDALDKYENDSAVWHISGHNEALNLPHRAGDAYLQRAASSWGWATWADRWQHFDKNPDVLAATWTDAHRRRFDLEGDHPKWQEVEANIGGYINSWAIFWYATIFARNGLCLYPVVSYVENIGFDNSGVHCGYEPDRIGHPLNDRETLNFPTVLQEDEEVLAALKRIYRRRTRRVEVARAYWRVVNKLRKVKRSVFSRQEIAA